jgi:hypothetical protein
MRRIPTCRKKLVAPKLLPVPGLIALMNRNLAITTVNLMPAALPRSRKPEQILPMPVIFFLEKRTAIKPARS